MKYLVFNMVVFSALVLIITGNNPLHQIPAFNPQQEEGTLSSSSLLEEKETSTVLAVAPPPVPDIPSLQEAPITVAITPENIVEDTTVAKEPFYRVEEKIREVQPIQKTFDVSKRPIHSVPEPTLKTPMPLPIEVVREQVLVPVIEEKESQEAIDLRQLAQEMEEMFLNKTLR